MSLPVPAAYRALHADAVRLLTRWTTPDVGQQRLREEILGHLRRHPDALWRKGPPAHLTASCLVLDADASHVLLTLHRKAHMWLQLGGHIEPDDASVHAAAWREAREESGIDEVAVLPQLVDLDRHALGGGFTRCSEHLDLRFVGRASRTGQHTVSAESLDVQWWPVHDLPADTGSDIPRLIAAATAALAAAGIPT